jgi:hypothetical protein
MKNKAIYPCSLKCSHTLLIRLIGRRGDEIRMSKKVIPSNSPEVLITEAPSPHYKEKKFNSVNLNFVKFPFNLNRKVS